MVLSNWCTDSRYKCNTLKCLKGWSEVLLLNQLAQKIFISDFANFASEQYDIFLMGNLQVIIMKFLLLFAMHFAPGQTKGQWG